MFSPIFSLLHARVFSGEQAARDPSPVDCLNPDPLAIMGALRAGQGRSQQGRFGEFRFTREGGALLNQTARIHAEAVKRCGGSFATYEEITKAETAALPAGQLLYVFGSGILGKHLSALEEMCAGGLSVDRVQGALKTARADDKIAAVLLHLDTPGGICYGMTETAALVRAVRATKTVAAVCDSLTASAGYWCACAADAIYATPSADLGSIGVYSAWVNYVEWCKQQGMEVKLFTDGSTYKGGGYPGTALSDEQAAKIQADVLACSAAFKADVRAGRPGITEATLQGQCFTGAAAVAAQLADALVNDVDEALADLATTI